MSGSVSNSPVATVLTIEDAAFRKGLADAAALINGYVRANDNAARSMAATATASNQAATGFSNVGQKIGQAGFQLQDFAVQVQGGTSALTALSQQGSQFLGVFGAGGAIAGAVLAVGILVAKLLDVRASTEEIVKANNDWKAGQEAVNNLLLTAEERSKKVAENLRQAAASAPAVMIQQADFQRETAGTEILKIERMLPMMERILRATPQEQRQPIEQDIQQLQTRLASLRDTQRTADTIIARERPALDRLRGMGPEEFGPGLPPGFRPLRDGEGAQAVAQSARDLADARRIAGMAPPQRAIEQERIRAEQEANRLILTGAEREEYIRNRVAKATQEQAYAVGQLGRSQANQMRAATQAGEAEILRSREALALAEKLAAAESPREAMQARQRAEIEKATQSIRARIETETNPAYKAAMEQQVANITRMREQAVALEETTRNRSAIFQQSQQLEEQRIRIQGLGLPRGDAARLLAETQERNRIINEGGDPKSEEALQRIANASELAFGSDRLQQIQDFQSAVSGIGSAFSSAADDLFTGAKKIGDIFANLERQILRMLTNMLIMKPLERGFAALLGQIAPTTGAGAGGIEGLLTRGGSALLGALGVGGAGSYTKGTGDIIGEVVGGAVGALKAFAVGGGVMPNEAYLVGERGPEIFMPNTAGQIIPNARPGMGGSDGGVTVNVWGAQDFDSFRQSSAQIGSAMMRGLTRARRAA